MNGPLVVARAIHFASTAAFSGLFLFLVLIGEPVLRNDAGRSSILRRRFLALGWISLALMLGSGAAWLLALAFDIAGRSWETLLSQAVAWTLLTQTQFGTDALVRLGLAALLAIVLLRYRSECGWRGRFDRIAAILLAAFLAGSLAWAGHGSAGSGTSGGLQLVADALHLVAAAGWIGGLPPLLLLLAFLCRTDKSLAAAAAATWRFSQFALVTVGILLATGIINTYFLVGSVPGLIGTDYGRLLLTKIALFAIMVAFAAANRYRHLPPFASPGKSAGTALARIERNGFFELFLGLVVLVMVAVLGTLPPAAHVQAWWPLPLRLNADAWSDPATRLNAGTALIATANAVLAIAVAVRSRAWRWPAIAAAAALLAWAGPRLTLLTAAAFPTSFFVSPTGYSAQSIAAGRAVFAEHCASCHGEQGYGDGPATNHLDPPSDDLTAEHIYEHSDGDLFWWITAGIGEAMPPFGTVLDETARWNLIDFLHANADARRLSETDATGLAFPLPEFSVECPGGSIRSIADLRGNIVHIVLAGTASTARLQQLADLEDAREVRIVVELSEIPNSRFCETRDANVIAAFAVYRGTDALDGTEFLVDASGSLRAMWVPGRRPDWREPAVFAGEIAAIRRTPAQPRAASAAGTHVHSH